MDYESVDADAFGKSLKGIGLNLLVRDVKSLAAFLTNVFDMKSHQVTNDFAIITYGDQLFQLHSDGTYHSHPLPSLIPESGARGGGIEICLYEADPDEALNKSEAHVHPSTVLQEPADKPHGLPECFILCENGYAWVPSRRVR